MGDIDPTAETAPECLGIDPDASRADVKLAAAKGKSQFNPDFHPESEKDAARDRLYAVKAAEDALLGDGVYPPPNLDLSENSSPEDLDVTISPNPGTIGEPVSVSVSVGGEQVNDGTVTTSTGEEIPIEDGWVSFVPSVPGTVTVRTAVPSVGEEVSEEVSIEARRQVSVTTHESCVSPGERFTVSVRDTSGQPIDTGRVVAGEEEVPIDHGRAKVSLSEPGNHEIKAVVGDETATTSVSVGQPPTQLGIEIEYSSVTVGDTVGISVRRRSDGTLVEGATVRTDRGHELTASRGRVTLTPTRAGSIEIVVEYENSETEYEPATATLDVEQSETILGIECASTVEVDESFPVVVRDQTGCRIGDAEIRVRQDQTTVSRAQTDHSGRTNVSLPSAGEYELRAVAESDGPTEVVPATRAVTAESTTRSIAIVTVEEPTSDDLCGRLLVRDESGDRVEGAEISVGDETVTTDNTGTAEVRLPDSGSYELRVQKGECVRTEVWSV